MSRDARLSRKPPVMQFSFKTFNSHFASSNSTRMNSIHLDNDIFHGLTNFEEFESKLGSLTSRPRVVELPAAKRPTRS